MILIADEPTGNLDPTTSVGIMKLLDRINRTGTTVLMATHDAGVVDQMRKRVVELDHGKVIRDQAQGAYGGVQLSAAALRLLRARAGVASQRVDAHRRGPRRSSSSMTLVGLGVLLNQQRAIATEYLGNQLEIAVYLCRDSDVNPSCTSAATDTQKDAIETVIEDSPEVEILPVRDQGGGLREGQEAPRRGPVRRTQPGDDGRGHVGGLLDHARGPQGVRGHHQCRDRPRRRLPDPRRAGDASSRSSTPSTR